MAARKKMTLWGSNSQRWRRNYKNKMVKKAKTYKQFRKRRYGPSDYVVKRKTPFYNNPMPLENVYYLRRYLDNIVLDGSGNINLAYPVRDVYLSTDYSNLVNLYQEYRMIKMTSWFIPTMNIKGIAIGGLFGVPLHDDLPAMSNDIAACTIASRVFSNLEDKKKKVVWKMNIDDPGEAEYHRTANYIPTSLGGICWYCNGPASSAGLYVGDIMLTYKVNFRGRR